ncbi:helix-turn-helix transcriptional regulator [Streptomyces vilmorinianum]|uniref:helix-turn-helix transcriptional regulator n=1 Tax=Streptomyces vilmorinianum TaxID=3051092 RepID=UPI0010FAE94E|nr:helix-turn-helix transcriptional regulator [Streptomyces vilmorinianum]
MLYGRGREQDQIAHMLSRAREGASSALVIHGEAGIGKTALLEYAVEAAGAGRVLRTVGIESEMELAFGGLHQLLRPVTDRLDRLPAPQAAALKAVFGLTGEAVSDRFTVGTAVLTVLSEVAGDGPPLLCLVDDVQWLDQASLDALAFAARRLHAEGVVMLFARRDGARGAGAQIAGLPRLPLTSLDAAAVDALLTDRVADLSSYSRDRIIEQAQGNPLALLELPAALSADQRAGQLNPVTLPAALSSPSSRIQEAFQEQIGRLPDATRAMLLVAAADDTGDLGLVLRAAARCGAVLEDLEPAERATLVRLTENTLSFRHPLIRSATYQDASLARRFAAHRALADALDADGNGDHHTADHHTDATADQGADHHTDATADQDADHHTDRQADATADQHADQHADRRAWHLAAATTGIDEHVADEMAGVARRAGGRQGTASASAAYERAAQLTADPARRARFLAAAAITSAEAGQFQRAAALADRINALALDPVTLAGFARVRAIVELDRGSPRQATRILLECADRIDDPADLVPVLAEAVHTVRASGDRELMAEVAARLPASSSDTSAYATMRALTGSLADAGTDRPARPRPRREPQPQPHPQPPIEEAGFAAGVLAATHHQLLADHGAVLETAIAGVRDCRAQDAVGWLPGILHLLAQAQLALGRYEDAGAAATEGLTIAEQFGRDHRATYLRATLATLAAVQGDQERCRDLGEAALHHAHAHGIELAAAHAQWALGLLDLGLGQAESALEHLEAANARLSHPALSVFVLPDLVEAAVRAGRRDLAEEPVARLDEWARAARGPAAAALARRCRALTGAAEGAHGTQGAQEGQGTTEAEGTGEVEGHFTAALSLHDEGSTQPFERARTELLYGEWLRRARRRTDARRHLRNALEAFEELGAEPWAHRARTELKATGETVDQDGDASGLLARLSPQEREVVRLAATGVTNREIAARLFLSPRTVGHHLYRAFPKLGVSSRADLPGLLAPDSSPRTTDAPDH